MKKETALPLLGSGILSALLLLGVVLLWDTTNALDRRPAAQDAAQTVADASPEPSTPVNVTYLTDARCPDCYDPAQHKTILQKAYNVTIGTEQTVDATSPEGAALIETYAIAQTPTVILSPEAGTYAQLVGVWQQVGSVEADGALVFRNNAALGAVVYNDLITGTIVRPEAANE
ncbi:hypothetical protein HY631_00575 [Candidatus Uhrbacteria bacterium]|nr:hypothetical protein [Candidatus Uhrbacteria bacterium]